MAFEIITGVGAATTIDGMSPKQLMDKGIDAVVTISDRYISTYNTNDQPLSVTRYGAVTTETLKQRWQTVNQRYRRGPK